MGSEPSKSLNYDLIRQYIDTLIREKEYKVQELDFDVGDLVTMHGVEDHLCGVVLKKWSNTVSLVKEGNYSEMLYQIQWSNGKTSTYSAYSLKRV